MLLSVTNSFEGTIFVEPLVALGTVEDYITNLVPTLNTSQVNTLAAAYLDAGLDGTLNQAIAVMGECQSDLLMR